MSERDVDDASIAASVMAGDADAEVALCRRFVPRVFAYGWRHLGSRDAAADLAQSTLCVVLERLRAREVTEPDRLASFVLGTARNLARASRRGEARRRAILERAGPVLEELSRHELDVYVLDRERLARCLDELPARQRTIMMLTFYAEEDAAGIAAELGTSGGNVRVARHRALAALHACLTGGAR